MKRFHVSIIISLLVAVAFTACVSQKSTVPGVTAIRSMPESDFYQADLDIPEFADAPQLNTVISNKVNGWFDDFVNDAELNRQMTVDFGQPFTFENQWRVTMNTSDCASILLTAYQFTGGANGEEKMASFTWNKLTNSLVTLEQLLPLVLEQPDLASLAALCREELRVSLVAQDKPDLLEMIQTGTEPIPENYDLFTISDKGLTIYFEKYQVAPGSAGSQAVLIPYLK